MSAFTRWAREEHRAGEIGHSPFAGTMLTQNCHGVTEIIPGTRPPGGRSIANERRSPALSARFPTNTHPLFVVATGAAWRDAGQRSARQMTQTQSQISRRNLFASAVAAAALAFAAAPVRAQAAPSAPVERLNEALLVA